MQQSNDVAPATSTPCQTPNVTLNDSVIEVSTDKQIQSGGLTPRIQVYRTAPGGLIPGGLMPSGILFGKNSFVGLPVPSDVLARFI